MTDKGFEYLKNFTALHTLYLDYNHKISNKGIKHLTSLTSLRYLNLKSCSKITDQGIELLTHLTSLQILGGSFYGKLQVKVLRNYNRN